MRNPPFDSRCPTRESTKPKTQAPSADGANFPFSVHGLAEQVGHSLTGKYPTGVFSKSVRLMKTVPIGDGFLFAAGAAILTFLLPSHTEGRCFPPSEGERRPKDGEPMVFLSIAKKYSTGIFFTVRSKIAYRRSPRVRTPAAYFKAHSRPFGNPSSFLIRVTVCRRQGGKVRAPHGGCVMSGAPV